MEIDFGVLPMLLGWAFLLLGIYTLLYYKYIYSVLDPLFVFVFTTSFASVLAISVIPELKDILHFFGCQLALWVGFSLAYSKYKPITTNKEYYFSDYTLLRHITYVFLAIYIMANLYIGYAKGFALLAETPTEAKIANFQEGFGFFRKINWSIGTFVGTSLIYICLTEKKRIDVFLLLIVIFFTSLDGSKSSMLQIAVSAGIILYHPAFLEKRQIVKKFQRYIPLIFVAIMGLFFVVLFKENESSDEAFFAFIRRLLYSADSVLYYYQPINIAYFDQFSFLDYVSRIVNPILGFFRIMPYQEAPGNIMIDNLRPPGSVYTVTVGPNAPFYIEGRIYFKYWAAFPYSMLVG
ncbi:hypothetical protein VF13_38460, partial [Nostoc linckia z16]